MKKIYIALIYTPLATAIITALFWAYRYIWFGIETVPSDRAFVLLVTLFLSTFPIGVYELSKN